METVEGLLIFIIAIVIASLIHSLFIQKVPLAFIQIFIGILIFILPIPVRFDFNTEVFMLLLIAPLLFVDGVTVSREDLGRYIKPIMLMALGLVFFTVIGVGFIIHGIWSDLPLAACFAIAAVLCPTDAVAVSTITKGKLLPKGSMTILEGESLFNDAAGIISFNIAILALMTGDFSLSNAVSQFLISAIGGLFVGSIIGVAFVRLRISLLLKGIENNNIFVFIQLLTPFVTFAIAEMFHASGIIAAVVAGLVHGFERDRIAQFSAQLQLGYTQTWNLLSYLLNGFVFVLLGYIVSETIQNIIASEPQNLAFLLAITLIIALLIYGFRFLWVYLFHPLFYSKHKNSQNKQHTNRGMYSLIMTLCGVHGTISLAIALTLPSTIDGQAFSFRDDLLFIASVMIIISLIIAQVLLPVFTTDKKENKVIGLNFIETRILILERTIDYLNNQSTPRTSYQYGSVIKSYHDRIKFMKYSKQNTENPRELNRLRHIAFETEMDTLNQLFKDNKLSQNEFDDYCTYTDHRQRYHRAPLFKRMLMWFKLATVRKQFTDQSKNKRNLNRGEISEKTANVMRIIYYNVTKRLSKEMTNDNELEVMQVFDSYLMRNDSLALANPDLINYKDHNHVSVYRIKLTALNEQRNVLNQLIESGEVSENIALQVSKSINYDEMMVLDKLI